MFLAYLIYMKTKQNKILYSSKYTFIVDNNQKVRSKIIKKCLNAMLTMGKS